MKHLVTPCVGKSWLFDSTDLEDHLSAKALCAECPLQLACADRVVELRSHAGPYGRLEGTWAGQLLDGRPLHKVKEAS